MNTLGMPGSTPVEPTPVPTASVPRLVVQQPEIKAQNALMEERARQEQQLEAERARIAEEKRQRELELERERIRQKIEMEQLRIEREQLEKERAALQAQRQEEEARRRSLLQQQQHQQQQQMYSSPSMNPAYTSQFQSYYSSRPQSSVWSQEPQKTIYQTSPQPQPPQQTQPPLQPQAEQQVSAPAQPMPQKSSVQPLRKTYSGSPSPSNSPLLHKPLASPPNPSKPDPAASPNKGVTIDDSFNSLLEGANSGDDPMKAVEDILSGAGGASDNESRGYSSEEEGYSKTALEEYEEDNGSTFTSCNDDVIDSVLSEFTTTDEDFSGPSPLESISLSFQSSSSSSPAPSKTPINATISDFTSSTRIPSRPAGMASPPSPLGPALSDPTVSASRRGSSSPSLSPAASAAAAAATVGVSSSPKEQPAPAPTGFVRGKLNKEGGPRITIGRGAEIGIQTREETPVPGTPRPEGDTKPYVNPDLVKRARPADAENPLLPGHPLRPDTVAKLVKERSVEPLAGKVFVWDTCLAKVLRVVVRRDFAAQFLQARAAAKIEKKVPKPMRASARRMSDAPPPKGILITGESGGSGTRIPTAGSPGVEGQKQHKRGFFSRKVSGDVELKKLGDLELRGDKEGLDRGIRETLKAVWAPETVDYWSSRPWPEEKWVTTTTPESWWLVDSACREKQGYSIESGWESMTHERGVETLGLKIRDSEQSNLFFKEFLCPLRHETYIVPDVPLIMTFESESRENRDQCCHVIVRTKNLDQRLLVPFSKRLDHVRKLVPLLANSQKRPILIKNPQFDKELLTYEMKQLPQQNYKFGIIYCKADQKDENQMFGNRHEESSQAYRDFLDFIGETITLKGWDKYRAGLDVQNGNTGVNSVYTTLQDGFYQIMFHVCTMLPYVEHDEQKIDRKRHIGNDVVTIIFKDQSGPEDRFDPMILTSHFIHCVFVISPILDASGKTTHYRVTVANKSGVAPYTPFFPQDCKEGVFEKNEAFRNWLHIKMINAERTAMASSEFQSLKTARKKYLELLCSQALESK